MTLATRQILAAAQSSSIVAFFERRHSFSASMANTMPNPTRKIKRICEEKSVDVETPESSWGTTGEQLLANKTLPARKPGFYPK